MAVVSEIRRLQGCVRVCFDDDVTVDVPLPLFKLYRLTVGACVERDSWQAQWQPQEYAFALDRAAALLSVRDATEKDVAERLRRSGYCEATVARVMQTLTQAGYVDDHRYADGFVQSRGARYGSRRLYGELRRKGVSDETAREALDQLSPEDETASAMKQAAKILARRDASDADVRRKAVQQLVRRGFDWDTAKKAVEAQASAADEEQDYTQSDPFNS